MRGKLYRFVPFLAIIAFSVCLLLPSKSFSFGDATLKYGTRGGDVYELQGRLNYLGYYNGGVDGVFGWQTYQSVRNFQWKFGMAVDGVVGAKTKDMLVRATRNWSGGSTGTGNYSSQDMQLLAQAIYSEARGEPYIGQVAVGAVILNRVKSSLFPNTISGVIFQPGAFTAVADGQFWLTPNQSARNAARDAVNGWDPSGGALYYFNPNTATSDWIWTRPQIKQIGNHIFTK
ncbi:spore cortex-lytic enzyme [Paenibacillus sp. MBLB4367]|uniref:spore cortex-lytic enzyme n=1 Tax=Paenibacillus sp. MBLB4367 TaxID=3384767 RepID=UPI003908195C